jgi:hypothetical protein
LVDPSHSLSSLEVLGSAEVFGRSIGHSAQVNPTFATLSLTGGKESRGDALMRVYRSLIALA